MNDRTVLWAGWPHAPAPLAAIRDARRTGTVRVIDDDGNTVTPGGLRRAWEAVRAVWQRLLLLDLRVVAALVAKRRSPPIARRATTAEGPVVVVLPIAPDLSHTFVYREVLAILRERPHWHVLVLAHNGRAPVHAEAEQVLARATRLRREGPTRAYFRALGWMFRRTGRELVGLYRAQPDEASRDLFSRRQFRDPRHPGNAFVLADQLRALRPRQLHVYSSTFAANVVMGAAHLLEVPFSISSYVDFEFPYSHRMLREKVARATFFRVVTEFCANRLRELPELQDLATDLATSTDRVPVIYLGLDLDNWQQRAERPGAGVFVSAARIVAKKGLHWMPAALALLRSRAVGFRWLVIGDGPELGRVRTLCHEHGVDDAVQLLGARDNRTVRDALLRADAAVLPCVVAEDGERDGIPIFLIEAMALGVPVVTTPISGIPELVRDGDTGFLCPPEDAAGLADALQAAVGSKASDVAERGREEVHRTLDVDASARQLIERIER